jgi:DNA-3-methyladenine glycosylase
MRLNRTFFTQGALELAPKLLGVTIVRKFSDGHEFRDTITELEVYLGEEDLACHASKGRTLRTEVLYGQGGHVYVYLIYGMYWLLNIVTGLKDQPQALLIRSLATVAGPGRVGKALGLDKSFYGEDLVPSQRLWLEPRAEALENLAFTQTPRIGVDYAGEWKDKPWRFTRVSP